MNYPHSLILCIQHLVVDRHICLRLPVSLLCGESEHNGLFSLLIHHCNSLPLKYLCLPRQACRLMNLSQNQSVNWLPVFFFHLLFSSSSPGAEGKRRLSNRTWWKLRQHGGSLEDRLTPAHHRPDRALRAAESNLLAGLSKS